MNAAPTSIQRIRMLTSTLIVIPLILSCAGSGELEFNSSSIVGAWQKSENIDGNRVVSEEYYGVDGVYCGRVVDQSLKDGAITYVSGSWELLDRSLSVTIESSTDKRLISESYEVREVLVLSAKTLRYSWGSRFFFTFKRSDVTSQTKYCDQARAFRRP